MKDGWIFSHLGREVAHHREHEDYSGYEACGHVYIVPARSSMGAPPEYRYRIQLDSLHSFGDGRHPTTSLCLGALHDHLSGVAEEKRPLMTMLDAGTGTGVLAILAWLMGVRQCDAVDLSEHAIDEAAFNASINGCDGIRFLQGDVAALIQGKKYDLITANLLPDVIRRALPALAASLNSGGRLLLSGVGDNSRPDIEAIIDHHGLAVNTHTAGQGWHCYLLARKG
jgi:ribosomal protein L11 methyltransferase